MADNPDYFKRHAQISLAALSVLFVTGIIFYKERLFFADAAFILFNILKYNTFYIQEHRYGSFITQLVPYAGVKMGWPVSAIIKGYAWSFNLFYLLAGIVVYKCRQYALVVVMALYYYLMVSDTYYWTNNEIHQAVAWMFVFFGVIRWLATKKTSIYIFLSVFFLLAFLAIYTHFIVLIPMLFLWVFLWIQQEGWAISKNMKIVLTVCIGLIIATKFLMVGSHSYDEQRLQNVTHLSLKDIFHAVVTPVVKNFFWRCFTNYWVAALVFLAGMVSLIQTRKFTLAAWCILSFIGYVLLIGITYSDLNQDVQLFYIESEWQCLSVVIAAPFVFAFLPWLKVNHGVVLLTLMFSIRLVYISVSSEKFATHYNFVESVLLQMKAKNINKLGIVSTKEQEKRYMLLWGMPDESMLLSALHGDEPQRTFTFVDTNDKQLLNSMNDPKLVIASFDVVKPEGWKTTIFRPDTLHPYKLMTVGELFEK